MVLVGSQGRGWAEVVQPTCCHPFHLEVRLLQWPSIRRCASRTMVEHQTPESKKSDREREDQGDRQRRSPGLSMPCSLRRTWRFFRSAVHSPTSSVARKHAERGESAGCHAGTGPYALCNKVGHHAGAGPVGALSLTGLGPGPRRPGCCPKTSRPTTNSTLICELSCCARYAGKIAPCVSCTDNGWNLVTFRATREALRGPAHRRRHEDQTCLQC